MVSTFSDMTAAPKIMIAYFFESLIFFLLHFLQMPASWLLEFNYFTHVRLFSSLLMGLYFRPDAISSAWFSAKILIVSTSLASFFNCSDILFQPISSFRGSAEKLHVFMHPASLSSGNTAISSRNFGGTSMCRHKPDCFYTPDGSQLRICYLALVTLQAPLIKAGRLSRSWKNRDPLVWKGEPPCHTPQLSC